MKLVDSHCHLPLIVDESFGMDGIVERAIENGIEHMLCVSVDLETFPNVLAAAKKYPSVSASVGVHPNKDSGCREPTIDDLLCLGSNQFVVAIGETGLDYYRNDGDRNLQKKRLITHIEAAKELSKPLIIHCREAAEDLMDILRKERADKVGGVMHCFVDNWETAQAALDLGFLISFSGIVTFKNATQLKEIAQNLTLESILVETDSPWLAPIPYRGKQNEPAYVRQTAEYISELREEDIVYFSTATTTNFYRLFSHAKKKPELV